MCFGAQLNFFGFLLGFRHRTPISTAALPTSPSPLSSLKVSSWWTDILFRAFMHSKASRVPVLAHLTALGSSLLVQSARKSSPRDRVALWSGPKVWGFLKGYVSPRKRACTAPQPLYQAALLSLISIAFSVHDILFARFGVVNRTPWKNI